MNGFIGVSDGRLHHLVFCTGVFLAKVKIEKWVLTPHAVERILDRKISMQELEQLMTNFDEIIAQGPKYLLIKRFRDRKDNNIAAVIIEKKGEDLWVVITVMVNFQKK